ncbi:MAG: TetR/AcrR family transcriptional regulator [Acidimicrobiia bacterium]
MARTRSPRRTDDIVEAALQVFLVRGYRRTRMTDVAAAAEVSPGLLYTYAASKEALFHLVLQRELGVDLTGAGLPAPDPDPDAVQLLIGSALREVSRIPTLEAAAAIDDPADARAELAAVIAEHYDNIHRYRRVIRLVERSALDWPELADRFYVKGRRPFVRRLADYIRRRVASGHFTEVPDPDVAARYVIEVVAWFANHRHGDRDGVLIDDGLARETVVELATRSFGPTTVSR